MVTDIAVCVPSTDRRTPWPRDFKLLWGGTAASQFGAVNSTLAGPLLALALTGSPVFAGWVTAAAALSRILLLLPAGVLVDRVDRHRVMVAGQVVRALAIALLMGPVLLGAPKELLLVAAVVQGMCAAVSAAAETTMVPSLVPDEHLSRAMSRNEARMHGADMSGRASSGLLFGLFHGLPFLADILSSLLAIIALRSMDTRSFLPRDSGEPVRLRTLARELGEGITHMWRNAYLRRVVLVCTTTNFLFQTLSLMFLLVGREEGLSSAAIGALVASSGLGGLVGSLVAHRLLDRIGAARMTLACVWAWTALTAVLAVGDLVGTAVLLVVLPLVWGGIGFVGAHMNVALGVTQSTETPRELLGRVITANRFFTGGAAALGAACSGHVLSSADLFPAPPVVALVVAVLAVALTRRSSKPAGIRRSRTVPQAPPAVA